MLRTTAASAVLTLAVLLAVQPGVHADETALDAVQASTRDKYIVRLMDQPAAGYTGGIVGLAATKPARGARLDRHDPDVVRYISHLRTKHDSVLASVGGRKIYDYAYALNGFAAELSDAQAEKLRGHPLVKSVTRNAFHKVATLTTPRLLGLDAPDGLWGELRGPRNAGRGVVVGVIATGIWPANPSFAADGKVAPPGWAGTCVPGESFVAAACNGKLIGARWFNAGFGGDAATKTTFPYEFLSPRAADGHGVHTASTAAGGYNVRAFGRSERNIGHVSGMAPGARIAVYKACWGFSADPAAGCANVDTVAAIDKAVEDGVHVINYSIGGSTSNFLDPVQEAFLFAVDAGVFVAAAAGNDGPGASTVVHNAPWVMTVAAGTHDRVIKGSVTLGNGETFDGVSLTKKEPKKQLILSTAAGLPGENAEEVRLCFLGTLDPARVANKIVVCDRGVNARVEKSQEVLAAGGAGMILANTSANTLNADIHFVPTVHVDHIVGAAIKAAMAAGVTTAQLCGGIVVTGPENPAPNVAGFSSRGPATAGGGDLLKPDILAPGVDVLAAYSPVETGLDFEFLQGTSMAAPHIAGLAALVRDAQPTWSPAAIKSALITTATPLRNDGTPILTDTGTATNAFGYGAGFVQPNLAVKPGLVYEAGFNEWVRFLCGAGTLACPPSLNVDPSDLNYPSIASGALAGSQTIRRTVTNVAGWESTYTASVQGLAGFDVVVSPSTFTIPANGTQTYTVTFTRTTAPLNAYAHGSITWADGHHTVRSPVALRPVALAAPAQVSGNGGPISYNVGFGYSGPFAATARGLVPAVATASTVADDPTNSFVRGGPGTVSFPFTIPPGTTHARISLFDANTDGEDDLDLYVYQGNTLVGASGGVTSAEEINFSFPNGFGGTASLVIWVHGFDTEGPDANFTLFTFTLGTAAAGNMAVTAPTTATLGGTGTIGLTFNSLASGTKYLGSVAYGGGAAGTPPTLVRVDP
jgi:subtilisin family serine protease